MAAQNGSRIIAGVPDLFFAAKIGETARQLGVAVEFVSSRKDVLERTSPVPALVILDLGAAALEPIGIIARLKADPDLRAARVVGFVNHERTDLIEQAKQAGCDEILTRGAFTKGLAGILTAAGGP
jgi:CheY-like chemotaxis protein